jgi:hypothetical protein
MSINFGMALAAGGCYKVHIPGGTRAVGRSENLGGRGHVIMW